MAAGIGDRQALSAGTQRVFFALWPDAGVRADLAQAARRMHRVVHGRRTRDDSIHLTVAFIGEVDVENLPRLLAPPAGVFTSAFLLTLDQWGCWARNGIGWAAPSHIPEPLRDLAANLEGWLRSHGFELEHRAFTPHMTLVRKAQCAPLPDSITPIAWQVNEFALIRSQLASGGVRYRTIRAWPLE
ncbi:MAG: RNA 2',3'-cyclic phosphodiesterase [Betaproteobacteria bacterium]|nr:RNA 2',3'-cyclic phosphodiesterase [Betaproteobacteria bacterium]